MERIRLEESKRLADARDLPGYCEFDMGIQCRRTPSLYWAIALQGSWVLLMLLSSATASETNTSRGEETGSEKQLLD